MIDYFCIALTHGLIALAAWYLLARDDLDDENAGSSAEEENVKPWLRGREKNGRVQGGLPRGPSREPSGGASQERNSQLASGRQASGSKGDRRDA